MRVLREGDRDMHKMKIDDDEKKNIKSMFIIYIKMNCEREIVNTCTGG